MMTDKVERITARSLVADAKKEINEELMKDYKKQLKTKLRSLAQAEKVAKNISREITDLEIGINDELQ